jgi:hypothetical protein
MLHPCGTSRLVRRARKRLPGTGVKRGTGVGRAPVAVAVDGTLAGVAVAARLVAMPVGELISVAS